MVSVPLRWAKRAFLLLTVAIMLTVGLGVGYGLYLSASLALPKGDEHRPRLVFGAPFLLKPDLDVTSSRLLERLQQLGYKSVEHPVRAPGDYRSTSSELDIYLREVPDQHVRASAVRLVLEQGQATRVVSLEHGGDVFPVYLEPQLISGLRGDSRQVREWLPYAKTPARFVDTLLAIEDRRFFSHPGIDPVAVGRALWRNLVRGDVVQGAARSRSNWPRTSSIRRAAPSPES